MELFRRIAYFNLFVAWLFFLFASGYYWKVEKRTDVVLKSISKPETREIATVDSTNDQAPSEQDDSKTEGTYEADTAPSSSENKNYTALQAVSEFLENNRWERQVPSTVQIKLFNEMLIGFFRGLPIFVIGLIFTSRRNPKDNGDPKEPKDSSGDEDRRSEGSPMRGKAPPGKDEATDLADPAKSA